MPGRSVGISYAGVQGRPAQSGSRKGRDADGACLADSLCGGIGRENRYTFALVRELVDDTCLVSETAIARAMTLLFKEHRAAVEGAAAVGVAAILEGTLGPTEGAVAAVITGNNIDAASFATAIGWSF